MAFWTQLMLLLWKNVPYGRRQPIQLLVELLGPLFLFFILVAVCHSHPRLEQHESSSGSWQMPTPSSGWGTRAHRMLASLGKLMPMLRAAGGAARPQPSDRLRDRLPLTTELLGTLLRETRWGGARPAIPGVRAGPNPGAREELPGGSRERGPGGKRPTHPPPQPGGREGKLPGWGGPGRAWAEGAREKVLLAGSFPGRGWVASLVTSPAPGTARPGGAVGAAAETSRD
uniref:ATP-binding cassette sub-family A member 7 n=1 Tax=Panthera leo TaxID=9689 RepID=A0A8C8WW38_PANLE